MTFTKIIGGAAAAVVAAAVLAGPADAAPSAPAAVASLGHRAAGSDVAARAKRAKTNVTVTTTPTGTAFYDIAGTLTSKGAPVTGKKLVLQFKSGRWKKATYVARTDAAGTVHYYGAAAKAGVKYRLVFPGTKKLRSSTSIRFLIDPRG